MKLVNLSKQDGNYKLRALIPFKILGITLTNSVREFIYREKDSSWYTLKGKKVSKNKRMILDKWLKDHKRFIE